MKMEVSAKSAEKMAQLEEGCSVTAGILDLDHFQEKVAEARARQDNHEKHFGIFGKLIELRRREKGLSREALAELADIENIEVFQIETNLDEAPEPRVVSRLAKVLNLPAGKLMQLVGHVTVLDGSVSRAAQRFAANSGSMEKLTRVERQALSEFVDALTEE